MILVHTSSPHIVIIVYSKCPPLGLHSCCSIAIDLYVGHLCRIIRVRHHRSTLWHWGIFSRLRTTYIINDVLLYMSRCGTTCSHCCRPIGVVAYFASFKSISNASASFGLRCWYLVEAWWWNLYVINCHLCATDLCLWCCVVNYIMLFAMNAGAVGSASATTLSKSCMLAAMIWYLRVHFQSARQK